MEDKTLEEKLDALLAKVTLLEETSAIRANLPELSIFTLFAFEQIIQKNPTEQERLSGLALYPNRPDTGGSCQINYICPPKEQHLQSGPERLFADAKAIAERLDKIKSPSFVPTHIKIYAGEEINLCSQYGTLIKLKKPNITYEELSEALARNFTKQQIS